MVRPKFFIISADLLLAFAALMLAFPVRFSSWESLGQLFNDGFFRIVGYLLILAFSNYFFELYEVRKFRDRNFIFRRVGASLFASFVLLTSFFYLLPNHQFGRGLLLISLIFAGAGQIAFRLLIKRYSRASRFASRILILGVGDYAEKISRVIPVDDNPHSYVGFVTCGKEDSCVPKERIVGDIKDLSDLVYSYRPHKIIVSLTDRRGALPLKEIMHSKLRGVEVYDAPTYYEYETGRLMIENVKPSFFIYTHGFRMTAFMRSYKRIFDILFSCLGLLLASPFFPVVALAIKFDSAGPVFFKQLRVGEREVEFFVYKFRTMSEDAEKSTGAVWAVENDPRVTRVGQFMRKTRIDEIPQLYNVLKGDMSFVGPRPERLAFVERLKETIPYYSTRHFVKPGVTGWAQVRYPYGASEEDALEKLRYDLFYIKNYSVFLDFKIILETVRVVLSGFGGR